VKKGGKLHIGGYSKPLLALTDRSGVEGFVPSLVTLEVVWDGFGLYVTGREDEAVAGWAEGRYDITMRSRDEGGSELGITQSRGTDSHVNNLDSWQLSMQCICIKSDSRNQHLDLQQLSKTSSTRISNAQSTATEPFNP
jgi:hypothetical protein